MTLLKNASTDAGNRVYRGRTVPVDAPEGDVVLVYEGDEESGHADLNGVKARLLDGAARPVQTRGRHQPAGAPHLV